MNDQKFKADAGKLKPSLLFEGVPRALMMTSAVLSYGAQKYEAHSWKGVAAERYEDAFYRHLLDRLGGLGLTDDESGLLHRAHQVCNDLFLLELELQKLTPAKFKKLLRFNKPPQGHKNG